MSEKTLLSECIETVLNEHDRKEFESEMSLRGWKPICEASLNRIMSHGEHGFIIISSQRSSIEVEGNDDLSLRNEYFEWLGDRENSEEMQRLFLKERNAKAEKLLNQQIKQADYAYSPVHGGYHPSEGYDEYELSYIVYNHKRRNQEDYGDFNELFKYAINWCKEFKQESVYVQAPGEAPNYYDCNGQIVNSSSSKNFKFNQDSEPYFTTTKRKTRNPQKFTADIQFENLYRRGISERVARMAREQRGEVIFDDIDIIKNRKK